jgi:hypothetical protein
MKPRLALTAATAAVFSLAVLALMVAPLPSSAAAAPPALPLGGSNLLYLPLVTKPEPPFIVGELQLFANADPDCWKANWDFQGPSPLHVTGPATKLYARSDIQNGISHAYEFKWYYNNGFWFAETWSVQYNDDYGHTFITSSNTYPCQGQLPKATYRIDLYVDDILRTSGTFIVE